MKRNLIILSIVVLALAVIVASGGELVRVSFTHMASAEASVPTGTVLLDPQSTPRGQSVQPGVLVFAGTASLIFGLIAITPFIIEDREDAMASEK